MDFEQRLPAVDGDDGQWGDILNQYLEKEHYNSGLNEAANGCHKTVSIRPGTISPGTAPLKFSSGPLMNSSEVGAVEFFVDRLYYTQTTDSIRKTIAAYDDTSGASGDVYYRDAGGNFIRLPIGTENDILTVNEGLPKWSTVLNGTKRISVGTVAPASPSIGDVWIDSN